MVQMPTLNTPQFSWVKSRLPRKPKPVPPIFQPEVAAEAIVWAADHDKAELYVAWPTVKAIAGNKIAPRLADLYLARNGYDAQQTEEPDSPDRPHNLWQPVGGDHRAHGAFDEQATDHSFQLWASTHRSMLFLAGLSLISLIWRGKGARKKGRG